jgi:hypothetical protein
VINFEKLPSVNEITGIVAILAATSFSRSSPADESLPLPLFDEEEEEEDDDDEDDEEVVEEEDEDDLLFLLASAVGVHVNNTKRMASTTILEFIFPSPCWFLCKIDAIQKRL